MQASEACVCGIRVAAILTRRVLRQYKQLVIFPAGFYVALAQGLYRAANITVDFLSPAQDAYKATPASRVASGQALLAITPSETVISYNSQSASATKPKITVTSCSMCMCHDTSWLTYFVSSKADGSCNAPRQMHFHHK